MQLGTHTLVPTGTKLLIYEDVFGHRLPVRPKAGRQGPLDTVLLTSQEMHPALLKIQCVVVARLVLHGHSWGSCFSPHVSCKGCEEQGRMVQAEVMVCFWEMAVLKVEDVSKREILHLTCQGALHAGEALSLRAVRT